jgi:hypothetical protein
VNKKLYDEQKINPDTGFAPTCYLLSRGEDSARAGSAVAVDTDSSGHFERAKRGKEEKKEVGRVGLAR